MQRHSGIGAGILIVVMSGGIGLAFFGLGPNPSRGLKTALEGIETRAPAAAAIASRVPAAAIAPRLRAAAARATDPLQAPRCPALVLTAVTESLDSNASLASLRAAGDTRAVTSRFRGSIGNRRVVYVGENPRRHSPAVWLLGGRELCQVVMREPPPAPGPGDEAKPNADREPTSTRLERIDANRYRVDRSLIDGVLERPEQLGARIDLKTTPGERGIRLATVKPGALLWQLGFRAGDRVESINGFELGDPSSAVRALAALPRAGRLHARVVRNGAPFALEVAIE